MFRTISQLHIRAPLRCLPKTLTHFTQPSLSSCSNHAPIKVSVEPSHSIPPKVLSPSISILSSPFSLSSLRQRHHDAHAHEFNRDPESHPKLFVVQPRLRPDTLLRTKLDEALNLANSLEEQRDGYFDTELCDKGLPPHIVVQNPAAKSPRADTYFGPGTVETIKCHLDTIESEGGLDAVFVNAILTRIQQRNLERAWEKPVLDRVGLIIKIFYAHAYTKEARLQAQLAALTYKMSRLVRVRSSDGSFAFGDAEVVSARGRGSGGRGFISGAGETELQLQRRRIDERKKLLLSEINEVRRTRALQRAARKRHGGSYHQGMPTVAVVGYTNAGKSTLVSELSASDLYSDDRLFATVDPKIRSVILPSGRKVLLSDTVGFISDLPVLLVESFHATLEEVVEADLLVHVLDSSAPNLDEQRDTVLQVLKDMKVSEEKIQNMIEVWNKIDLQEEEMGSDKNLDDEEDELGSFSGKEVDDVASEQLSEEGADDYYDDIASDGTVDDQQGDYSDGWLSSVDGQEAINEDGQFMGWETPCDQQSELSNDCRKIGKDSCSQAQSVPHVKISAIMGVGLQELLELIDAKLPLETHNVVERSIFDSKWRPPRTEDTGIAVE
ncbi:GTP-binding protein At3g49725, chloroplastic [Cornus florida]|uniref:GTP-binding protein At3g49725, chloroplastic n=1 Tax=Cornus florida TaxID=4283 RepID=UPI00289C5150|nr:GTP-binding protein At3g49725, chloroplastic [Cornus florida]